MNRRTISVASLQLKAHDREAFDSVWPHICAQIQLAAADGAELIVLPEGTVPGYVIGNVPLDSSVTERALSDIQGIAQRTRTVIVYGTARFQGTLLFNSALVVDSDGSVAGHADKCFLWHFDRQWFTPGEVRKPVRTSIGTLGVMICADGRIPTIARALVDAGAEVLVMPTAWVSSGRDPENLENVQADLLARVRAHENGVPFLAANKAGVERGCVLYCGKSQLIDCAGELISIASQEREETLAASISIGGGAASRSSPINPARSTVEGKPVRLAIGAKRSFLSPELQGALEADFYIGADPQTDDAVHSTVAAATADDATVMDPGGLVPYKLAGYQLIIWRPGNGDREWQRRIARARALELRLFVVCIVADAFAFAADPDGAVICGTFGDYTVASFSFSPERTKQTLVAPGTDIIEGLERVRF